MGSSRTDSEYVQINLIISFCYAFNDEVSIVLSELDGKGYAAVTMGDYFCAFYFDGTIALGYNYQDTSYNKSLNYEISNINGVSSNAFNNPNSWFYSCNTARNGRSSFLWVWHNKVGGFSGGYSGYTSYYNIMGLEDYNRWNSEWRKYNDSVKKLRKQYGFSASGAINYPTGFGDARQVTY